MCAVPHNLESKPPAAPGQSPTGSVCYERNGVNLCIFLKPLPDPPCDLEEAYLKFGIIKRKLQFIPYGPF